MLGEEVGDRMISDNRTAGGVFDASTVGNWLGELFGGPRPEIQQAVTPEAEVAIHNVSQHWTGKKQEPTENSGCPPRDR